MTSAIQVMLAAALAATLPSARLESVPTIDLQVEGTMSSVRLLTVGRSAKHKDAHGSPAPDGLTFSFLVVRKPKVEGLFTLTELRDFKLDGASYAAATRASLGQSFEPDTKVFGAKRVHLGYGSTVAEKYSLLEDSPVMITTIFGAPLPDRGMIRVVAKVGWGNATEAFPFEIDLAKVPRQR